MTEQVSIEKPKHGGKRVGAGRPKKEPGAPKATYRKRRKPIVKEVVSVDDRVYKVKDKSEYKEGFVFGATVAVVAVLCLTFIAKL